VKSSGRGTRPGIESTPSRILEKFASAGAEARDPILTTARGTCDDWQSW
jgi:hypothetical protein